MKRILRSALAGVLCITMLITPCTVSNALGAEATFENAVVNSDGTITISGINWDDATPWIALDSYPSSDAMASDVCIYAPDDRRTTFTTDPVTEMLGEYFDATGTYDFYLSMHKDFGIESPNLPYSCQKKITVPYTRPSAEMNAPTNVHWDGYTLKWDGDLDLEYSLEVTWIREDGSKDGPNCLPSYAGLSRDMADSIGWNIKHGYKGLKCSVKTVSRDAAKIANSQKVEAPVLDFEQGNAEISNKLDNIDSNNPETVKDEFSDDSEKSKLMVGMTTDKEISKKIASIENAYIEKKNITVKAPEVSKEVKELGVSSSNIKVVGAGLNAGANQEVTLKVTKTEKEVEVPSECYNPVQIDIKLDIDGSNKTNLDIPVSITMPIPSGVEKQGLVIYHVHGDGSKEYISHIRSNADNTITFTVKGFSTFVFANKKGGSGSNNDSDKKRTTYRTPVENAIKQAVATGGSAEINGITALSYDEMKELSKNPDAKLVMHFTYNDEKYKVIVTGKDAVADPTIPWYGPLYLVGKYGNSLTAGK